jgi:hypothetical protein
MSALAIFQIWVAMVQDFISSLFDNDYEARQ